MMFSSPSKIYENQGLFVVIKTILRESCFLADPPEGVQLQVSEVTVCKGENVIFNCSATDAKPMELTYHLYENNVMVMNGSSSTGIWNRSMATGGVVVYSCKVTNIIGTAMSTNVSVTVNGKHGTFLTNRKTLESKCPSLGKILSLLYSVSR